MEPNSLHGPMGTSQSPANIVTSTWRSFVVWTSNHNYPILRTLENCRIDRVLSFLCTGFKRNSISPILNSSRRHRPKQQCVKGCLQLSLESMIFSISTDDGPDEFNPQRPDLCPPCLTESNCMWLMAPTKPEPKTNQTVTSLACCLQHFFFLLAWMKWVLPSQSFFFFLHKCLYSSVAKDSLSLSLKV